MDDNDLKAAAKKIHEAQDAEAKLAHDMPYTVHPDEAEYRAEAQAAEGSDGEDQETVDKETDDES